MAVMAKVPRSGAVKTRLVPPLTGAEAKSLSEAFLSDMTANIALASRTAPIAGYVAYAPAGAEAEFAGILAPGTGLVLADGSGPMPAGVDGLGRCLLHATRALLATGAASVCLVNADSPTLPTSFLVEAATALLRPGERVVLGPAEDGGYYLIGLKAPHARLFADVAWSTPAVSGQTRAQATALGLDTMVLPTWYDVDDPATLTRLAREFAEAGAGPEQAPSIAPATAALLARLQLAGRPVLDAGVPA
jgi:rSAM/selenodomain-associated transferase 1